MNTHYGQVHPLVVYSSLAVFLDDRVVQIACSYNGVLCSQQYSCNVSYYQGQQDSVVFQPKFVTFKLHSCLVQTMMCNRLAVKFGGECSRWQMMRGNNDFTENTFLVNMLWHNSLAVEASK